MTDAKADDKHVVVEVHEHDHHHRGWLGKFTPYIDAGMIALSTLNIATTIRSGNKSGFKNMWQGSGLWARTSMLLDPVFLAIFSKDFSDYFKNFRAHSSKSQATEIRVRDTQTPGAAETPAKLELHEASPAEPQQPQAKDPEFTRRIAEEKAAGNDITPARS